MKDDRISNEQKRPAWREYGSLFRAAVSALLLVALLTQGLPMRAIAEQAQTNQVAQTDASQDLEANASAANVPESTEGSTLTADTSGSDSDNADALQEGGTAQEGNNEQESVDSQDDDDAKSVQESKETQDSDSPAIDVREESNGLIVSIYAPEGAFPEGTTVKVEPVSNEEFMAAVDDLVDGDLVDARAVDISFIRGGNEIEPANGHAVSVDFSATSPVGGDDFAAVHVRDNGSTEVVDDNATKQGASFKATDFSVYGIVGGTVIRGEDEQYTRIKAVFRNGSYDGAVLSTQIVHEGDSLVAPDVTPPSSGETFRSWRAGGKDVDSKYLTSALTEQDIQDMIGTYGATEDSEGNNLWLITIASHFEEGYRAYFHWNEKGAEESDTVVGCLRTVADGTVHLEDIQSTYKPPREDLDLIGWIDEDNNEYALDATPTLTKDTHFYPEFSTGNWIKLDMGGAPALSDVLAQYNEETGKYDLQYDDLPNDIVSDQYFYPGYTFEGWYLNNTYSDSIAKGSTAQLDDSQKTIYAKWTPSNEVPYTIVYLAEDSSGTPGHGNYYIAGTEVRLGPAGANISASDYRDHVVDAYHHYCKDEDGERELHNINEEPETIKGDGSTIKVVYYNSNRIKLVCNRDRDGNRINGGNSVLPSEPVKPGESLDAWIDTQDEKDLFEQYVKPSIEGGNKKYIEHKIPNQSTAIYSFSGKSKTIPYEAAQYAVDGETYYLEAYTDEVKSQVKSKYYYEALDDAAVQQAQAENIECKQETVDGEERWFILDHQIVWGTARPSNEAPWEYFGSTYENGGLVERAYKAASSAGGTGVITQIPDNFNGPKTVGNAYRYDGYYYDHYFVRTRWDLKFSNCENVSPQPTDTKLMFGTKLGSYLPNYTKETTRMYGGVTYTFDGWYSNRSAANNPDDPDRALFEVKADTLMPAQSTTVFAGWRPKTFTITFDAQGGTIVNKGDAENPTQVNAGTLNVQVVSGQRIPMADRPNDVEREGYIFGGWYLDKDFTIPLDYDTFTSQSNTTIYARWVTGQKYTLTYHKADGTVVPSQNTTFLAYSVISLDGAPEATHDGLPFLGWSTKQGDVNKLVPNTFILASDINLYAVYGNVGYSGGPKVTLHANYPNGTEDVKAEPMLVSPYTKNGQVKLPGYAEVKFKCPEGYRFLGWTPDKDGTGKIYAADKLVAVDKDTDLYAVWTKAPEPTPDPTPDPDPEPEPEPTPDPTPEPTPPEAGTLRQVLKDSNYGGAKVAQSDSAIAEAVSLTNDELVAMKNGQNADFWIEVTDVSSTLDDETKNALHAVMDEGYTKGAYLDVTAWVKVGDAEARQLHKTKSALTVAFSLASDLKADGRSYEVSRSHDGKVDRVTSNYEDDQLTIDSDRFSYFEIAYKDKEEDESDKDDSNTNKPGTSNSGTSGTSTSGKTTPNTGDPQSTTLVVVLLVVGVLVTAAGLHWRRLKE